MSSIPESLKYVASHEWIRLEADGSVVIGITDHAQELLGDIVFVEFPEVGHQLNVDEQAGVVESVKAASDVYAPISGEVIAINSKLVDEPETANTDPYGEGWFLKMKPENPHDVDKLMSAAEYAKEVD